jgi:hypothetical protein
MNIITHYWDLVPNKLQPTIYSKPQAQTALSNYQLLGPSQQLLKETIILTVNMTHTDTPHGHWPKIFLLKACKAMQCSIKHTKKRGKC